MTYFNTTRAQGRELSEYIGKAKTQEDRVMEFARHNPTARFTAEDLVRTVLAGAPVTSARRCLTLLEQSGMLVRLSKTVDGQHGRPVHAYQYRDQSGAPKQGKLLEKCDGNHGGPRCTDPECWNDD